MDLKIIESVFGLREEMDKVPIGIDVPDLEKVNAENAAQWIKGLGALPDAKLVADLMPRAIALDAEADEWHKNARAPEQRLRPDIVQLLTAASAPLPVFDDAELTSVAVPPARPEPIVPRAPSRPTPREPAPEPIRDVAPRAADTTASTPTRKPAKKPSKKTTKRSTRKPKKKPE